MEGILSYHLILGGTCHPVYSILLVTQTSADTVWQQTTQSANPRRWGPQRLTATSTDAC